MKNALWKDIFRDIAKSKGRFISIVSIIALGVMLFTGVKMAPVDMKASADKYYDDYNLMDLRVVSTLGLTDEDLMDIKNINNVSGAYGEKSIDVLVKNKSNESVIRVHSLPKQNNSKSNGDYINQLNVIEGTLPKNSGECVIGNDKFNRLNLQIGDTIKLISGDDKDIGESLHNIEYKIVGIVETPYYLSNNIGSSSIGSGTVNNYIFLNESEFKSDIYTDIFVTVTGSKELNSYDDEYFNVVDKVTKSIEEISLNAIERRKEQLQKLAYEQLTNIAQSEGEELQYSLDTDSVISNVEEPQWYVLDRKSHYSYVDYENNTQSIDKLSNVFPVFFFVVAALVCLTTMTRMVDEQRVNIGTLKALGYSKWNIAKKFIVYAFFASLVGCLIGLIGGFTILPLIIYDAYGIMYMLPKMKFVFDISFALIVTVVSVGVTTLVTYAACRIEVIETPAILMRPKAPKEGKRILLERVPFIWNRFNFTSKVTLRNIFRYKKRFLMTVIGIAGSTALLVAGFGLKDSISTVVNKQYGDIFKYQLSINLEKDISDIDLKNLQSKLDNNIDISEYLYANSLSLELVKDDISKEATLVIPSDATKMRDFIYLQNRITNKFIELPNNGVVITEKLANLLKVQIGDEVTIKNSEGISKNVMVAGISENYMQHFVYISNEYYNSVFNVHGNPNEILVNLVNGDSQLAEKVAGTLINEKGVSGIVNITGAKDGFSDTIKSLDLVVFVMILCAGALSFVVLYNLTNVNISERIREIATIKVLGFYHKEVAAYIYRENILLTLIGLVVGLILGVVFHRFIMVTVEMEFLMFGRTINILSFLYASLLTIAFALLVNWVMYYKLKNVKMVESLKSVD